MLGAVCTGSQPEVCWGFPARTCMPGHACGMRTGIRAYGSCGRPGSSWKKPCVCLAGFSCGVWSDEADPAWPAVAWPASASDQNECHILGSAAECDAISPDYVRLCSCIPSSGSQGCLELVSPAPDHAMIKVSSAWLACKLDRRKGKHAHASITKQLQSYVWAGRSTEPRLIHMTVSMLLHFQLPLAVLCGQQPVGAMR